MDTLRSIHVDFSPHKTHKSERFYEFAKRVIYKDVEVSPFPYSALRQSAKSSNTLVVLLRESVKRNWEFISISSSVKLYFSIVREFRSSLCKKISRNSEYFVSVLDLIQGVVPAYVVFNDFIRKNNLPKIGLFKE